MVVSFETSSKNYYSINAKYANSNQPDLGLDIKQHGSDSIEIEIINLNYKNQCRMLLKRFIIISGIFALYCSFIIYNKKQQIRLFGKRENLILYPAIAFILITLQLLHATLNLVKSEKVFYCWTIALQIETIRAFSRQSHYLIPASSIHDVLLNEVIEDLDVRYVLIVRTKGTMFKQQPIVTVFKHLHPTIVCLQKIYQQINKISQKNLVPANAPQD